ncbi:MAG TPA: hypothetical protein V6C85_12235 [Allocoleopsis sp.]
MPKFSQVVSTVVATTLLISGWQIGSMQKTRAQPSSVGSWATIVQKLLNQKDNTPPGNPGGGGTRSWTAIFRGFFNQQDNQPPGNPGTGGTRGGICAIAPLAVASNTTVWSDRPLFIWRGLTAVEQVQVRLPGSNKPLWSRDVSPRTRRIPYGGTEPLQPGRTYQWVILGLNKNPIGELSFKVMDAPERDRIKTDLKKLDEELKAKRATPEDAALQRANFFAQRKLWSDALQEAYIVQTPSEELKALIRNISTQPCSPQQQLGRLGD